MPELPDVEIFKRYLDSTSLHQRIQRVDAGDAEDMRVNTSLKALADGLKDNAFSETRRHGKHLFVKTGGGRWLTLHFGMTGFLKYYRQPSQKPDHTRLRIDFTNGYSLAFDSQRRLGRIGLIENPMLFR